MAFTREQRDALPDDAFAVPRQRKLPIRQTDDDERHVRMAWRMLPLTAGVNESERRLARDQILARAAELGIDLTSRELRFELQAVAVEIPEPDHPNKMPFSGILARVDQPSDQPPGGSGGKRVLVPKAVAEEALGTLMGMAVDCTSDFSGHDSQFKIGLITEATIDGNAIRIAGFLYANDFPEECARIRKEKNRLGFSYECQVAVSDQSADPWLVDRIVFTGAAILYKDKAAYQTTSLAASAAAESEMSKEILDAISALSGKLENVSRTVDGVVNDMKSIKAGKGASLAGPIVDQVEPHVAACHAAADRMEAAGIGAHPMDGHAAMIRRVAAHMLQCAVGGHLPHIFRDHDYLHGAAVKDAAAEATLKAATEKNEALEKSLKALQDTVSGLNTQLADLKAAAAKKESEGDPARKTVTLSAEAQTLVKKYGLTVEGEEPLSVQAVDKALEAAGVKGSAAMTAKLRLRAAGLLN